jgi:hypothetical protein
MRDDGKPLGSITEVQRALKSAFPGIELGRLPSGVEKIQATAEKGIEFPDVLRRHFETALAEYGGDYEGPDFSAQFYLGADDIVQEIGIVLYGDTTACGPMLEFLEREHGWITTHP